MWRDVVIHWSWSRRRWLVVFPIRIPTRTALLHRTFLSHTTSWLRSAVPSETATDMNADLLWLECQSNFLIKVSNPARQYFCTHILWTTVWAPLLLLWGVYGILIPTLRRFLTKWISRIPCSSSQMNLIRGIYLGFPLINREIVSRKAEDTNEFNPFRFHTSFSQPFFSKLDSSFGFTSTFPNCRPAISTVFSQFYQRLIHNTSISITRTTSCLVNLLDWPFAKLRTSMT